jgi:hypothetical protein
MNLLSRVHLVAHFNRHNSPYHRWFVYTSSLNIDRRSVGLLSALPLLFLGFENPVSIGRGLTPRKLEPASSSKGFRPPGPDAGLLLAQASSAR